MTALPTNLIMDHQQIDNTIRRMAYQIYENNIDEQEIILAGIDKSGFTLSEKLCEELKRISPITITSCNVSVNKRNPLDEVKVSIAQERYTNKSVILVDDVLNSGATLIYGIKFFLNVPLKKFQTAVLVDRSHKRFPVKADYKGISLSTSLHETVKVTFDKVNKVVLK
ncbi:phosphoribosyltransferase domain-containing protein [Gangjinia marincola]|uniref:Phosphoribosyltransferase domain-containing protein n=1 Tax=Gangjinia marincola TaxID=578463 RepID=A0ABP3XVY6_9FLAO